LTDLKRRNIHHRATAVQRGRGQWHSTNLATPARRHTARTVSAQSTENATAGAPKAAPTPSRTRSAAATLGRDVAGLTGISAAKLRQAWDQNTDQTRHLNAAKFIEKPSRRPNPDFPKRWNHPRNKKIRWPAATIGHGNNPDSRSCIGYEAILADLASGRHWTYEKLTQAGPGHFRLWSRVLTRRLHPGLDPGAAHRPTRGNSEMGRGRAPDALQLSST